MLLLVLLFPLQLFAGTLAHMPEPVVAAIDIVSVDAGSNRDSLALPGERRHRICQLMPMKRTAARSNAISKIRHCRGEELTLSAVWHSFPHLFPRPAAWASSLSTSSDRLHPSDRLALPRPRCAPSADTAACAGAGLIPV